VLVSFGGEDRENLSARLLNVVLAEEVFLPSQITLVEGPLFAFHDWPPGIVVVRNAIRLRELMRSCDLLLTHFGTTALEAFACGIPVILFNPGSYHERLGRAVGFPDIGIKVPNVRVFKRLLEDPARIRTQVERFNNRLGRHRTWRLPGVLASMRPKGTPQCPVCRRDGNRVLARFADRTYRSCSGCGVMYLESFAHGDVSYGVRYFGRQYKAQYGRTYLEDFQAIKKISRERLTIIHEVTEAGLDGAVLDVGCAYGPFLSSAKDEGLAGFGIDVSEEAVSYVRKKLGLPAVCSSFETVPRHRLPGRISAVTFWFVIEHFTDVDLVLRKVSYLLPIGGALAFSSPNGQGISARKDLITFLDKSPGDHFTIFRPAGIAGILASYGLELRRIRVTGHHPERFPGILGKLGSGAGSRVIERASRLLGFGDTFEAYAVKVSEL
jgi:SAM-dependent methyltransferase